MALVKGFHISDVPCLDQIPQNTAFSSRPIGGVGEGNTMPPRKFLVMGHRGTGMNLLQSPDRGMKAIKENSLLAFNAAAKFDLDFVEFDVQVTKDDCVVIFHDNFIFTEDKGSLIEKRVTDLTLDEFLSYGPQRDPQNVGKPLFRKTKDGGVFEWKVEKDDCFCTLQEVFQKVDKSLGFNIEFKFDDNIIYKEDELVHVIQVVLQVVSEHASDRPIVFSTFQPDAALLVRKLQDTYPVSMGGGVFVCFLTNGGSEIYKDSRRNSLDEAIKLCLDGGLHGIVSEIKALLRNPGAVAKIHGLNLSLISYGQLNNVAEVVYLQYLMGVDGVIVDLVEEITEAVAEFSKKAEEEGKLKNEGQQCTRNRKYTFQEELSTSCLSKLVPELIQQ